MPLMGRIRPARSTRPIVYLRPLTADGPAGARGVIVRPLPVVLQVRKPEPELVLIRLLPMGGQTVLAPVRRLKLVPAEPVFNRPAVLTFLAAAALPATPSRFLGLPLRAPKLTES